MILATHDGGATWVPQTSGTRNDRASVYFAPDARQGWTVGHNGTILSTRDGGTTWTPQTSGTTSDLASVYFTPGGRQGWAVGSIQTIITTTDGGRSWYSACTAYRVYPPPWFWVSVLVHRILRIERSPRSGAYIRVGVDSRSADF